MELQHRVDDGWCEGGSLTAVSLLDLFCVQVG